MYVFIVPSQDTYIEGYVCVACRSWRHGMYIIIHVGVWMLLIKEYLCMSQLYNILLYIL